MSISPARTAAFDVLLKIERDRAYSSVLLPQYEEQLSGKDRRLCHEITLGVLRQQLLLDRLIDSFSSGKKLDIEVRVALRMGLFQLRSLDKIPAYSAINESVELVRRAKKSSASGFVNAILRRAQRETVPPVFTDETDRISIETSHPRWLIEKWTAQFGSVRAESIATSNNRVPRIAFRLTPKFTGDVRPGWSASCTVEGAYFADGIDDDLRQMAECGDVYFQDEGSQMVALSTEVPENGRFLDVCAAPGGKTSMVAARSGPGARIIVAGDLHSTRVRLLKENCGRQGLEHVGIVQYDATSALPFADGIFDTVLVDAPCSGTGTIRHNPELRYFLSPNDITELNQKQLLILGNASNLVAPGGRLIYSTCSLETEEDEGVCESFISEHREFRVVQPSVPARFKTGRGFARTFPDSDDMDGFFIASFLRGPELSAS